jgi:ATP-dependent helicase/nuclease subunit B
MDFLRQTATYLHEHFGDNLHEVLVLLPSRRTNQFLSKHLAAVYNKPVLAPGILAVEDFVEQCAGLHVLPRLDLTLRFFQHYQSLKGDEAEPFAGFLKWAAILLQDFNEIDRHRVPGDQLYDFLHDLERLNFWSPDAPEKLDTPLIQRYLQLTRDAGHYYQTFAAALQRTGHAYQGMAYRTVADRPDETIRPWLKKSGYRWVVVAGLNALNTCETVIFEYLQNAKMLHILWDADEHYLEDPDAEAGRFMRHYRQLWVTKDQPFQWRGQYFSKQPKTIRVLPVPGMTEQARAAGRLLAQLPQEALIQERTALVLADENLLLPVIQALPENITAFNITMGYPLYQHPYSQAVLQVLRMHAVAQGYQERRGHFAFYHKQLFEVLQHPLFRHMSEDRTDPDPFGADALRRRNVVYYRPDLLTSISGDRPAWSQIAPLFEALNHPQALIQNLAQKLGALAQAKHLTPTEREVVWKLHTSCTRLADLITLHPYLDDLKTLEGLLTDFFQEATVDFFGEPMKGLQIMGVLETRALDFDHLILLSVNEGTLPSGRSENSMIPFEVKKKYNMPAFLEKDAVYAYHFYRLLQRAKDITLIYSAEDSGMGKGEPSRFIRQVLHELADYPNIDIQEEVFIPEVRFDALKKPYEIPLEPSLLVALDQMATTGFSPTSISNYLRDPLAFYKNQLLKIREDRGVEEEIFSDTLGKAVHQVLEDFYRPFLNQFPESQDYKQLKKQADLLLKQAFQQYYAEGALDAGANLMIYKVGENMIRHYASHAHFYIDQPRKVFELEAMLKTELLLPQTGKKVKVKGQADRIDVVSDVIQIVDYKTGHFKADDIKFNAITDLFNPEKGKYKALQLVIYAWLLWRNYPDFKGFTAAIAPLRGNTQLEMLKMGRVHILDAAVLSEFEFHLADFLENLFLNPFSQDDLNYSHEQD